MPTREVLDPQVEVDLLLRCPVGPVGRDMVGCQLNPDRRFSFDDHHAAHERVMSLDAKVLKPAEDVDSADNFQV
jgi:hypothetical protein